MPPPAATLNSVRAAPAVPGSGVILLDRHIEKNGGTSFRHVLLSAERAGRCMYWGFSQKSVAWRTMIAGLQSLRPDAPAPRICIEAHSYIDFGGYSWIQRLSHLESLRADLAERFPPVQLLLHVRLREPLSYYISFYAWGVAARQAEARDGARGRNFTDWLAATPNLQAENLLSSASANTASYGRLADPERLEWLARWSGDDANSTARASAAWRTLANYDVVGTTERYDECVAVTSAAPDSSHLSRASELILARLRRSTLVVLGRLEWGYQVAARAPRPKQPGCVVRRGDSNWWCYDPTRPRKEETQRIRKRVCPDMRECLRLIRCAHPRHSMHHCCSSLAHHTADRSPTVRTPTADTECVARNAMHHALPRRPGQAGGERRSTSIRGGRPTARQGCGFCRRTVETGPGQPARRSYHSCWFCEAVGERRRGDAVRVAGTGPRLGALYRRRPT
jgi:hypothetical protein